jgi:hypothetical protein
VEPDHVAFRVINQGDKAVLSDGLFWLLNSSAVLNRPGRFDRAVTAGKIAVGYSDRPGGNDGSRDGGQQP